MHDIDANRPSGTVPDTRHMSRGHVVAITIAVLAVLGSIAVVVAAFFTTEIEVDDLLDSLEPVRIPALLFVTVTVVASLFLAGRVWARWLLALVLAGGAAWILIFSEISGTWLRVALAVAVVWGLSAIALVVSRRVALYMEHMTDHWMTAYERLIGPLRDDDDARRWLSMLDTWDGAGVLTRGDRTRVARALRSWSQRTGPHADDVGTRIDSLAPATGDHRLMSLAQRVVRRRKPTQ